MSPNSNKKIDAIVNAIICVVFNIITLHGSLLSVIVFDINIIESFAELVN